MVHGDEEAFKEGEHRKTDDIDRATTRRARIHEELNTTPQHDQWHLSSTITPLREKRWRVLPSSRPRNGKKFSPKTMSGEAKPRQRLQAESGTSGRCRRQHQSEKLSLGCILVPWRSITFIHRTKVGIPQPDLGPSPTTTAATEKAVGHPPRHLSLPTRSRRTTTTTRRSAGEPTE